MWAEIRFDPVWSGLIGRGSIFVVLSFNLIAGHDASADWWSAAALVLLLLQELASVAKLPCPRFEGRQFVI
jgi:hypothetical protein